MNDSLYIHDNKGLNDLLEYFQDLLYRNSFLLFIVTEQIAFWAILHSDLK